jgi:hypothetical protein
MKLLINKYKNYMKSIIKIINPDNPKVIVTSINKAYSVAHELGHNLGLQHTFNTKLTFQQATQGRYINILYNDNRILIPITTTRNLMDYPKSKDTDTHLRYFFKYQIEHLK